MAESKQDLLRKLKALADNGVNGEKENAQRILRRLLDKYDVDEAELEDEAVKEYSFKASVGRERSLLIQVCYKITNGDRRVYFYRHGDGSRSTICCECTKAESIRIAFMFDFFRELWKDEEEMFFRSFIQKHQIYSDRPGEGEMLEPEEEARMFRMMQAMQDKTPELMIEARKECRT